MRIEASHSVRRRIGFALGMFAAMWCVCSSARLSADGAAPLHAWSFAPANVHQSTLKPVAGDLPGTIHGAASFTHDKPGALKLDGRTTRIELSNQLGKLKLPAEAITVEAWAIVDKPMEWGGIVSAIQDNGDYERGFLLGFRQDRFCFGVASQRANRLTYLTAKDSFTPGQWYHVAGVYDGATLKVFVNGELAGESAEQQGPIVYPPTGWFELGAYHDDNEHYFVAGELHSAAVFDKALTDAQIATRYRADAKRFPLPARLTDGPYIEWTGPARVRLSYETDRPSPTIVEWGPSGETPRQLGGDAARTRHAIDIDNLATETNYEYRIIVRGDDAREAVTSTYTFDSTFDYQLPPSPDRPSPFAEDAHSATYAAFASRILKEAGVTKGYCLIVGVGRGRLAYELARRSELKVVAVDDDAARIAEARRNLDAAGLYGVRVSVHHGSLDALPYGPYFANIITSDSLAAEVAPPFDAHELHRVLRPAGGVLVWPMRDEAGAKRVASHMNEAADPQTAAAVNINGAFAALYRRPVLPDTGEWSHQYGTAANAANSGDNLVKGEMEPLWWGEPGPRPMPDRGARNPSPLAAHGRLFVQGDRILFGIDAYNGTILWTLSAPHMRRSNIPRDSTNMVATDDYLYLAVDDHVIGIDAQTGQRKLRFDLPRRDDEQAPPSDWGALYAVDDAIIGAAVRRGAGYKGDTGEWYDDIKPGHIDKVISDRLFVIDRRTGALRWSTEGSAIVSSTITAAAGHVYFIESRDPDAVRKGGRQIDEVMRRQFLVCVSLESGRKVWEREHDFSKCRSMMYLSYANHTLLVTGSDEKKAYHLYAFDAQGGSVLWDRSDPVRKNHHGGHIQHPVHIGDQVFVNQHVIALRSGQTLRSDIAERRGCGTMAASNHSLFYRHHFHGMWDLASDTRSEFQGIRGGCWLGIIPAGGVVLAPETSSGCSCTHAIQTSVAWTPRPKRDQERDQNRDQNRDER